MAAHQRKFARRVKAAGNSRSKALTGPGYERDAAARASCARTLARSAVERMTGAAAGRVFVPRLAIGSNACAVWSARRNLFHRFGPDRARRREQIALPELNVEIEQVDHGRLRLDLLGDQVDAVARE